MSELKCLENIIGLSQTECPCYDDNKPADADVSKSGLFLDELEGLTLQLIGSDVECGDEGVWSKMEKAVKIARNTLRTDVLGAITEFASTRRSTFMGKIGQLKSKTIIVPQTNYMGIKLNTYDIKGGEFTLKGITTWMDQTAMFDVYIYNNVDQDPLLIIPNIESLAGQKKENPLAADPNLTFPLYSVDLCGDNGESSQLEYYIVYQPIGFNPRDNKIECGCARREEWTKWVDADGITGDDVSTTELREAMPESDRANGLILDVVINCATANLICGGENEDLDYMNDPTARVIANCIQLKAGEVLINDILSSGNINRFTMMSRESLYGKRNHYAKEYGYRIDWLGENMSIEGNDCLGCQDNRIQNVAILT